MLIKKYLRDASNMFIFVAKFYSKILNDGRFKCHTFRDRGKN